MSKPISSSQSKKLKRAWLALFDIASDKDLGWHVTIREMLADFKRWTIPVLDKSFIRQVERKERKAKTTM